MNNPNSRMLIDDDSSDGIDIMSLWRTLQKRAKSIAMLTLAITLVGVAVAFSMQSIYRSTATIAVEPPSRSQSGGTNRVEEAAPTNPFAENLQTQVEILLSRNVMLEAVKDLQLWRRPDFSNAAGTAGGWLGQLRQLLGMPVKSPQQAADKPIATPTPDTPTGAAEAAVEAERNAKAEALVGAFSSGVTARVVPRTQIISISFDSPDPAFAATAANAVVRAFIAFDQRSRVETAQGLNADLLDRAKDLEKNLRASERALQQFREKNNLVALRGASQGLNARQLEELMPKVVASRVKVTELETALRQVRSITDGNYTTVPWVMNYGGVPAAREREIAARFKVAELSQNYGYEHPRMIQGQAELREAGDNLRRQIEIAVSSLAREYENARSTEQALDRAMKGERSQVQEVNRIEFQLGQLEREVENNKQLYDAFIARAKQLGVTADIDRSTARIVNAATASGTPYSPNKPRLIALFFLGGLAVSIGLALFLDRLDNTIKGPGDAENRLGLAVVTTVPLLQAEDAPSQVLLTFTDRPDGLFAEAFRTARTGLLLSALDEPTRVFMVTSSTPGEGKTTTATNLALALSQTKPTLLIEGDLRRPRLSADLGLPEGAKGLANLAAGDAELSQCLYPIANTSLTVMPTGDIPPNPLDLLLSRRFEETIASLKTKYEFIVIDSPPVELVSDAVAISRIASGVLYVIRASATPFPMIVQGLEKLRRANAPLLGLVLNQVDFSKAHRYYGDYSGYGVAKYGRYSYYGQGYSSQVYGGGVRGDNKERQA